MSVCVWRRQKAEAEKAVKVGDHDLAAELYKKTLSLMDVQHLIDSTSDLNFLDSDDEDDAVMKIQFEAAKVCTNISLMYFKLWEKNFEVESAKQSKKFAILALKHDKLWPKGFLRSVYASIILGQYDEAAIMLERFDKKFGVTEESTELSSLINIRQKPGAETALRSSKRFSLLQYPHNAFCIDAKGSGHFDSMEEFLSFPKIIGNNVSVLIKPGNYEYPPMELDFEYKNVDIVGDCKIHIKDGILVEDPNINFKANPKFPLGLFLTERSFFLRRLKISLAASDCTINLEHCSLSSSVDYNPSFYAIRNVVLSCKSCRCHDSKGFEIENGSQVEMEKCFFRSVSNAIWLTRDISVASFSKSVFENISCCAINASTGVKKLYVKDCKFTDIGDNDTRSNSYMNSAICTSRCNAVIQDSSISFVTGTGILIGGAKTEIRGVKIRNCSYQAISVNYAEKVLIKNSEFSNSPFGVYCHIGAISFEGNNISSEAMDVMASPMCQIEFLGDITHKLRKSSPEEWQILHGSEKENMRQKYKTDLEYKRIVKKVCNYCKCSKGGFFSRELDLKACSGCKVVRYCSVRCQKRDWKYHKANCSAEIQE